jgi:HD-GYP domain-containing protein (c-di-GMP phosphodiesterase class II)
MNKSKSKTELPDELILFLGKLADLRDPYISDHATHVRDLSVQLAIRVNFPSRKIKALSHAALLHDIGKLVLPEQIVNKPSRLTEAEYLMVQQHTVLGYKLVSPLEMDAMIGGTILSHHENFDGSGYPYGLVGEAIPLEARIVRITDFYDALICQRPYREAFTAGSALDLLLKNRRCFDPSLLEAFLHIQAEEHRLNREIRKRPMTTKISTQMLYEMP